MRRILVLNEAKELVGITSLGELATVTGDRRLAGETLEAISEVRADKRKTNLMTMSLTSRSLAMTQIAKKAAPGQMKRE